MCIENLTSFKNRDANRGSQNRLIIVLCLAIWNGRKTDWRNQKKNPFPLLQLGNCENDSRWRKAWTKNNITAARHTHTSHFPGDLSFWEKE